MNKNEIKKIKGLTNKEVMERIKKGQINKQVVVASKTIGQIIASNVFTYLNLIIYSLALILILIGEYINTVFIFTTIFNMLVGIIQETRIKLVIDKLTVLSQVKVSVIRNGIIEDIDIDEIVLDDILYLNTGDQICSDAEVIKSVDMTVNESLLTGEADAIAKNKGSKLLSGSFVVTGYAYAKVCSVGENNYTSKIMLEVKKYKKTYSELLNSLNKIIKTIGIFIVPLGLLLFFSTYLRGNATLRDSIITSIGGVVGMIPQGLVVLSNVSFALGVIKMAKHNAFLKSLPSIETFSRVNVICFDKTGTLTEGIPYVDKVEYINDKEEIVSVISNMNGSLPKGNPTSLALEKHFGTDFSMETLDILPFTSDNKYSAVEFKDHGTYILGAYELIFKKNKTNYEQQIDEYLKKGYRLVVLGHSNRSIKDNFLDQVELRSIIVLRDKIKSDAKKIIQYLEKEKIDIKVISGDNPMTTSMIASYCGIKNYDKYIDMSSYDGDDYESIVEEYTIFGRTTPYQKQKLVKALKNLGKTTAMTGDGVNDLLALKESDFSIAMASGSEAAKNVSEVILMDSNFSSFPKILTESRKIINNIQNLAVLYLTKTIYSSILVILSVFLPLAFPFIPIQLSVISITTIGIPSFFFIFVKSTEKPEGNFIKTVLSKALPFALAIIINYLFISILSLLFKATPDELTTLTIITTEMIALTLVYYVSRPINNIKRILNILLSVIFIIVMIFFSNVLSLSFRFDIFSLIVIIFGIFTSYILVKTHKIQL